jgi:hypothetical protein
VPTIETKIENIWKKISAQIPQQQGRSANQDVNILHIGGEFF